MNSAQDTPRMVSTADAARILGVAKITLAKWRCTHTGPVIPYVKCGRYVKYDLRDLIHFLERHSRG